MLALFHNCAKVEIHHVQEHTALLTADYRHCPALEYGTVQRMDTDVVYGQAGEHLHLTHRDWRRRVEVRIWFDRFNRRWVVRNGGH